MDVLYEDATRSSDWLRLLGCTRPYIIATILAAIPITCLVALHG